MTRTSALRQSTARSTVLCQVQSLAVVRADAPTLAALRRNPGSPPGLSIPPTLFKAANDQTVAALVAVLRASAKMERKLDEYKAWGVLAATTFFGRAFSAHGMQRYVREGAWGITPQMVPHHSLHAISGTISQAFRIQGPNFGIGGGPRSHAEGLLAAATFFAANEVPGLWLVLTGHDPEEVPGETEDPTTSPCECIAVAMALVRVEQPGVGPHLVLAPGAELTAGAPLFTLKSFAAALEASPRPACQYWDLPCGGAMEWHNDGL